MELTLLTNWENSICSTVKYNFTPFQFTFNIMWDKPINHLAWKEEQYQLIYATNQKHIIFVVVCFQWNLELDNILGGLCSTFVFSSFKNPAVQSNPFLSYCSTQIDKSSDSVCWHMAERPLTEGWPASCYTGWNYNWIIQRGRVQEWK